MRAFLKVVVINALIISLANGVFIIKADSTEESIANRLRESGIVSDSWVDALEWALFLREENRNAILSLEVVFSRMTFYSPKELHRQSERKGMLPADALPNPQVQNVHFVQQDHSRYVRSFYPKVFLEIASNSSNPILPSGFTSIPVEHQQEYVETEIGQFFVVRERPLSPDLQLQLRNKGSFSTDGAVKAHFSDVFTPQLHEATSLEGIVSRIADGSGILKHLDVGLNEEGRNVIEIMVKYNSQYDNWDVEEWSRSVYSLDDNGLLIERESDQLQERRDGEIVTNVRQVFSDISFVEFHTNKGRVVLPSSRLYSVEKDGELREQQLLMVDINSLQVNEEIPWDVFRVSTIDIYEFDHYLPSISGERRIIESFRTIDELPEEALSLTLKGDSPDSFSSAERFPFDEEWTENLFAAYGGTGGGGGTPFGNIELARYAQNPVPQTYSGVMPFGWLNANTLALAFGLFLIIGGLVLRNLPLRRGKQSVAQSV